MPTPSVFRYPILGVSRCHFVSTDRIRLSSSLTQEMTVPPLRSGSEGTELLAEEMHRRSESSERLYLAAALGYGSEKPESRNFDLRR